MASVLDGSSRPAQPGDAAAVAAVLIESRRAFMPFAPAAHSPDEIRQWVAEELIPGGGVRVAELEGRIVAVIATSEREGVSWIDQLCVLPGFEARGLGSRMLAFAQATLPPPIRLYTFQQNAGARRFYERHGYSAIAFGDGSANEERCPDVLYERNWTHVLETERLVLRRLQRTDLDSLYALYRDPDIRRYFPDGTRTLEETSEELDVFLHGHPKRPELGLWATIEKKSGAFLGRCGLLPWTIEGRPEVELAYLIDKARWREGFATEASLGIVAYARDALRLERLICLVMPGNEASAGVARKVGMQLERDFADEYGPCHIYARSLP